MLARLTARGRAGAVVHDALSPLQGNDRVQTARIASPDGERTLAADVVALNLGFQPETGLARALGIPHRFVDVGLGHLATETDADGRTAARRRVRRRRWRGARRRAGRHGARPAGRPGGGARSRPARAGRSRRPRRAGARTGIPGRAVAIVPPAAAVRRHSGGRHHRLPLRGGHRRPPARRTRRRPDLPAGAEEGDARRHGPLPGPLLRRHHRAALPRRARRLVVRRAACAAAPGARRAADVRGPGIRRSVADRPRAAGAPARCRRCRRRRGAPMWW